MHDGAHGASAAWITRSLDGGQTWSRRVRVDLGEACPCCRTALATGRDGTLYMAWRHVFPGSMREIVVARSTDHGASWSDPVGVHDDESVFDACLHAGPALRVDRRLHPGVRHARMDLPDTNKDRSHGRRNPAARRASTKRMRVFITGAASPLGRALTSLLVQHGHVVIGQVRRRNGVAALRKIGAQPVLTGLAEPRGLTEAMAGCELVFHLARYFDFWAPSLTTFHDVNVFGCERVMDAAVRAHARRVVLCSSALTIGERPGEIGNERTRHRGYTRTAVERSQLNAETVALRYRSRRIDVVVVNPALVLAPSDPGWTGRLLASQVAGRRRFASLSPVGWVSVHDAALGLLRAAEAGESGERYILCGDTLSPFELLTRVAKLAGKPAPQPISPAMDMARACVSSLGGGVMRRRPTVPMDEARFASGGLRVSGLQATVTLGIDYTPLAYYLPAVVASYRKVLKHFAE